MTTDRSLPPAPDEAARDWLVRLTSGVATDADAAAFARWRDAHEDHRVAMRELLAFRRTARSLADRMTVRTPSRRRILASGGAALAASLAGLGLVRPPFDAWPSFAELTADHRTEVAQRASFAPAPGIAVELNARSSAATITDGLSLIAGELFVTVSADAARPFALDVGGRRFAIRHGSADVRTDVTGTCITCLSGEVNAATAGRIAAGQQLIDQGGNPRMLPADGAAVTAWRRGLLIFDATPLGTALAAINRYLPGRIVVTDAATARRTVTGVFHTDRVQDALAQFQQLLDLDIRRLPGGLTFVG